MDGNSEITVLKGVGEKKALLLRRLGIYTVEDLLSYFPRDYEKISKMAEIKDIPAYFEKNEPILLRLKLALRPTVSYVNKYKFINAKGSDETGQINLQWVNQVYLVNALKPGNYYNLRGRIKKRGAAYYITGAKIIKDEDMPLDEGSLMPKYSLTKGLTGEALHKLIRTAIDNVLYEKDYLGLIPDSCRFPEMNDFIAIDRAVEMLHFPKSCDEIFKARNRLVFDEFFFFLLNVRLMKENRDRIKSSCIIKRSEKIDDIIKRLPYTLTNAQIRCINEIMKDLEGEHLMNRLVQGDVGSGKTIVAFLALINAAINGYQGILMAPTEVLARQHYEQLVKLLDDNGLDDINVCLLTGTVTAAQKKKIKASLEEGGTHIVVGTHAVIQNDVVLNKAGLVITDEQHRFGVKQREKLSENSSIKPHTLVMSATPIPRTLAIIIYGDLDISVIDELPASRLPIKNCVVGPNFRNKAYEFIRGELEKQHQALVVCPMVEESEGLDAENVIDSCDRIREWLPAKYTVKYLHGRMSGKEKNAIMEEFAAGDIDVLVSTTVIEVGINVPNTTVMLVENAERFGLAQLHQLRGRVGRGAHQSYCIFMCASDKKETLERLDILNKSNDGFMIAREDLRQRGPGDLFGLRQSGDMTFKLGDIYTDAKTLKLASDVVKRVFDAGCHNMFAKPGFSVL